MNLHPYRREPSAEEQQILNHLLVTQTFCNADLYPRALAACLARHIAFLEIFRNPDNEAPDFELEHR